MKILIYLMPFLIIGCSSNPIISREKIQAPPEIMHECDDFVLPRNGYFEELLRITVENKKLYEICKNQNKAKLEFIKAY